VSASTVARFWPLPICEGPSTICKECRHSDGDARGEV
jgi:hypothetical protein